MLCFLLLSLPYNSTNNLASGDGITPPRPLFVVRYNGPQRFLVIGYTTGRAFCWRSLRTSATNPAYCTRFPSSIPRTDPASAPCRSWHYFPRHPVPVRWVLISSYPPPGFPAPVHRYAPRSFMCLLALCRLGCSLRPFGLFTRLDPAPPRIGSDAPGHNPARGPFASF